MMKGRYEMIYSYPRDCEYLQLTELCEHETLLD